MWPRARRTRPRRTMYSVQAGTLQERDREPGLCRMPCWEVHRGLWQHQVRHLPGEPLHHGRCDVLELVRGPLSMTALTVMSYRFVRSTIRTVQWRIYLVKFWTRVPHGFQIISIPCSFWGKFGKIICWRPLPRVGAPTSVKSWIRNCS